jgi:hypothetical protein
MHGANSPKTQGRVIMKQVQSNILNALEKDFKSVWEIGGSITEGIESKETPESKIANQLQDAIWKWADARSYMAKTLSDMIRNAEYQRDSIQRGFRADAGFLNAQSFQHYIARAENYENQIINLMSICNFTGQETTALVTKINSLIGWK